MRLNPVTSLALLSFAFLLAGCTADVDTGDSNAGSSSSGMVSSTAFSTGGVSSVSGVTGLGTALRDRGLTVSSATALSGETLFPEATASSTVTVNGQSIQVYEFASVDTAAAEAGTVSRDGNTIRDENVSWVGMPHFYRSGNVIILYLGNNPAIMTPLDQITGGPFAGTGMEPSAGTGATL